MSCFSSLARREWIYGALSNSKAVLEAGKPVLEALPVPSLAPAADVLIALIGKVEEVRTTHAGLEELSTEIKRLVDAIESTKEGFEDRLKKCAAGGPEYRAIQDSSRSSGLESRVTQLCRQLNELKNRADDLYKGPCFLRCFYSSRDAETLSDLRSGVVNALRYFTAQCQVLILGQVDEVLRNLSVIGKNVNDGFARIDEARKTDQDDKILKRLPHVEASYHAFVNTPKSRFLEGTRSELLGDLEVWAEGNTLGGLGLSSKPICVLTGEVGTGKSTIASEFAKRLNTSPHSAYGASFFFNFGVDDLSSAKIFFPTIAHELAHVQAAFRQPIIKAARQYLGRGLQHQQLTYAGELVRIAISEIAIREGRHPAVLLVIDGIDECSGLVPDLLDILKSCVDVSRSCIPLKVFITSRPDHGGTQTFLSKHPDHVQSISLDDPSSKYGSDEIPNFLHSRFSQTPPGRRVLKEQPQLVEELASLASRSFLLAQIAMESLESDPQQFQLRLQQMLADRSVREASFTQTIPPSHQAQASGDRLDSLYLFILQTAFPPGSTKHQKDLRVRLQTVLGCVALLPDHLSAGAIEAFTSVSREDSKPVLQKLRAVLSSDGNEVASDSDAMFRPMHASFPQFLVDPARCTNPLYLVDKPRESARIAQGCLNAVMSLAPHSGAGVAGTEGLADGTNERVSPHVRYACLHWASHFREAKKTAELNTALDRFTAPETMQKWVETLGQLGRLDIAEAALDSVSKLEEPKHETKERLVKVRQLVVERYEEIENSPSMVYSFETGIKEDSARGAGRNPHAGKSPQRKETEYFDAMSAFPGGYPKDSA